MLDETKQNLGTDSTGLSSGDQAPTFKIDSLSESDWNKIMSHDKVKNWANTIVKKEIKNMNEKFNEKDKLLEDLKNTYESKIKHYESEIEKFTAVEKQRQKQEKLTLLKEKGFITDKVDDEILNNFTLEKHDGVYKSVPTDEYLVSLGLKKAHKQDVSGNSTSPISSQDRKLGIEDKFNDHYITPQGKIYSVPKKK